MTSKPTTGLDRFTKVSTTAKPRLIWAGYGEIGSLKTTFGLSAPGPIIVQSLDRGLEGVVEEWATTKDIRVCEYDWTPTDDMGQDEAIRVRDEIIADFEAAIGCARTVLWDKETQIWEVFRYAEFGAPNGNPRDYGALYQRYRRLFNMAKASTINFGVIQGMRSPWNETIKANGKSGLSKSAARERKGMDEVEELVHINIEHYRDEMAEPGKQFKLRIGKARGPGARSVQYRTFDYMDFVELAMMVFPDSDDDCWL